MKFAIIDATPLKKIMLRHVVALLAFLGAADAFWVSTARRQQQLPRVLTAPISIPMNIDGKLVQLTIGADTDPATAAASFLAEHGYARRDTWP